MLWVSLQDGFAALGTKEVRQQAWLWAWVGRSRCRESRAGVGTGGTQRW